MRNLGLLFITVGFVGGALCAVLERDAIPWSWFVPFLAIGAVGVGIVQYALRREATDETRTTGNIEILGRSLQAIVGNAIGFDGDKETIDVYDMPARIDATFREDIGAFVDARESIAHVFGTRAYADVMSHFAAGERYLNRVWSCAADGYVDEARAYIARSREQFEQALERLQGLGGNP